MIILTLQAAKNVTSIFLQTDYIFSGIGQRRQIKLRRQKFDSQRRPPKEVRAQDRSFALLHFRLGRREDFLHRRIGSTFRARPEARVARSCPQRTGPNTIKLFTYVIYESNI
jgi:hypothetical protein